MQVFFSEKEFKHPEVTWSKPSARPATGAAKRTTEENI